MYKYSGGYAGATNGGPYCGKVVSINNLTLKVWSASLDFEYYYLEESPGVLWIATKDEVASHVL